MKFYDWQEEIIRVEGDATIRGGRQSGKSWAVAEQIRRRAIKYPGSRHLILAATERQENFLLDKVKDLIGKSSSNYKGRVTLTHMELNNGTHIFKYPVGRTGVYIEGLSSIDFIYIDEAIHVGWKVFDSILPMLVEPKKRGLGWITLLSATAAKPKGYYFESFKRKNFTKFQIKTSDCEHADLKFLEEEKIRLGPRMFSVIYEGEFDENAHKYFPKELILRNKKGYWDRIIDPNKEYYLGTDPARYGRSKAAFAVSEYVNKMKIKLIYGEEIPKSSLLLLRDKSIELDRRFKRFKKHYIDDGGIGGGLVDLLEEYFRYRLVPLNNKNKTNEVGKILKEDLYSNLLKLLETNQIELSSQKEIINGLLDVELDEEGKIKGTDMSEAITRAVWPMKSKGLKLFLR